MQVGYHNQTHKNQHGEHGCERGEPCPGSAVGTDLVDQTIAGGTDRILLHHDHPSRQYGSLGGLVRRAAACSGGRPDGL